MLGGNAAGHAFADSLTMCAPGVKELAVAAGLSLLNWLIIEPYVTGLMFQRYDIEVPRCCMFIGMAARRVGKY